MLCLGRLRGKKQNVVKWALCGMRGEKGRPRDGRAVEKGWAVAVT